MEEGETRRTKQRSVHCQELREKCTGLYMYKAINRYNWYTPGRSKHRRRIRFKVKLSLYLKY
jgi:hypothetical protein